MSDLESRPGERLVMVGVMGGAASSAESFLVSMRLSCRGVQALNLGTGVTLGQAAAEVAHRPDVQALLLVCATGVHAVAGQLAGLAELKASGSLAPPVFVGGARGDCWRELRPLAAHLRGLGVAQVLADLADAAYLLPVRRAGLGGVAPVSSREKKVPAWTG
ncbi:hypothetical protein [Streptomyces sp. SH5]|uniref:Uncharacterized protein n=1 Tax=Streptomyces sindenensis TaxID=67363 RepID=A0ABW6ETZ2_9ACTN|nr:hypothetical protein [Streptomyces sp. SH5]WGP09693.1 hypothetical protein QFA72_08340 [Streptomyces sp. SH5]